MSVEEVVEYPGIAGKRSWNSDRGEVVLGGSSTESRAHNYQGPPIQGSSSLVFFSNATSYSVHRNTTLESPATYSA